MPVDSEPSFPHLVITLALSCSVKAFAWTFITAFILFKVIAITIGLRVTEQEEMEGLDLSEHGANSYPDFVSAPSMGGMSIKGE